MEGAAAQVAADGLGGGEQLAAERVAGLVRASVLMSVPSALYAAGGCIITGVALGFGSKFWHDMLDIVFNAREGLKQLAKRGTTT